jgi:hypothetical protein
MIYAKINPVLSMANQSGHFNPDITYVTASIMIAAATPYPLGADKVQFRVSFGEITPAQFGDNQRFNTIHSENLELTAEELADWGVDDSVVLEIIADKKGTSVVEIQSGSIGTYML